MPNEHADRHSALHSCQRQQLRKIVHLLLKRFKDKNRVSGTSTSASIVPVPTFRSKRARPLGICDRPPRLVKGTAHGFPEDS